MKKKEINSIEKLKQSLQTKYGIASFDYIIDDQYDLIYLQFPNEEEEIEFEYEELEKYIEDLDTITFHPCFNKVSTNHITQRCIKLSDNYNFYTLLNLGLLYKKVSENISIHLISNPLLIGIAAAHFKEYNDYHTPCTSHIAVEILYSNIEHRLSNEDEEKLIKIFMFELSNSHKISFEFSTYKISVIIKNESIRKDILESSEFVYNIPLKDYNYGMDLFINSNQRLSSDLKFLSYYKIFEYFGPVKAKIKAFDFMRLKLNSSDAKLPSADYISSIFELAKNYDKSKQDYELIKPLINSTFDLIDIYNSIPLKIRKKMKVTELKYSSKQETKDRIITELGDILYRTRNSIVHAKSNFDERGFYCEINDLEQLNEFMHKACYSTIKWYNDLPEHLKINVG
ncbi:hypothetical protein [Cellulophaga sp. Z1A5H]|uniref:hypothetical protein n=1 Tax=Cellulophaga sp. Z1A5H TaxID=2687291 RepID=UPI0013FD931A|nr:hypothetical protein [Cellulophaga sp. Z1A5H]